MATVAPARPPAGGPAFQPYVSPAQRPAELTIRALILGAILGIVFSALVGLERAVGPVATSDLFAILAFFGLGAILYRVARR